LSFIPVTATISATAAATQEPRRNLPHDRIADRCLCLSNLTFSLYWAKKYPSRKEIQVLTDPNELHHKLHDTNPTLSALNMQRNPVINLN